MQGTAPYNETEHQPVATTEQDGNGDVLLWKARGETYLLNDQTAMFLPSMDSIVWELDDNEEGEEVDGD